MTAEPDTDRRPLAVFDIDGVLADVRHRLHHIGTRPKDWASFFASADADPLLSEGYERVRELAATHDIVFLTGRPQSNRKLTEAWLDQHGLPRGRLFMRPSRDFRPARVFKAETLRKLSADREIAVIIDDDPQVIDELRRGGYPAELATWVPYADALSAAQERDGRT